MHALADLILLNSLPAIQYGDPESHEILLLSTLPVLNRDRRLVGIVSLGDLAVRGSDDRLSGPDAEWKVAYEVSDDFGVARAWLAWDVFPGEGRGSGARLARGG